MTWTDRHDAGTQLAYALKKYERAPNTIVLAIPRGGVEIGSELAARLHLPLDVIVTKKIGAPGNPEFAIGSVDASGIADVDEQLASEVGLTAQRREEEVKRVRALVAEKERQLREGRPPLALSGAQIILTDDGIATGHTMRAAIRSLRAAGVARIVLAVPVAATETATQFLPLVDESVILQQPQMFYAVGQFYDSFEQVSDNEVKRLLRQTLTAEK